MHAGVVIAGKTAVDVNAVSTELEDVDSEVSTWDGTLPSPTSLLTACRCCYSRQNSC